MKLAADRSNLLNNNSLCNFPFTDDKEMIDSIINYSLFLLLGNEYASSYTIFEVSRRI